MVPNKRSNGDMALNKMHDRPIKTDVNLGESDCIPMFDDVAILAESLFQIA